MKRSETRHLATAVQAELERAMTALHSRKPPRPYFLSHLVRDIETWTLRAKFGCLAHESHRRRRHCFADVRVGSHRYDQVQEGGLNDNCREDESFDYIALPYGTNPDGVRHGLWRLTDARYREAVDAYLDRKANELTFLDRNRHLSSFEKRTPVSSLNWRQLPEVDMDRWRRYVTAASKVAMGFHEIKDGYVEFQANNVMRLFASHDGTLAIECVPYWRVEVYLWLLSEKGDAIPWTIAEHVCDPEELPSLPKLKARIRRTIGKLRQLAAAPRLRSYSGPVLLEPLPAGLLLHEALGHRLEGNRLLSTGEGQTFRDSVGSPVLPEFLSMWDDPSLTHHDERSLIGHYPFDDEGVPAQRADLITDGVLRGFMTTRIPTGKKHVSNGHARANFHERPISRMGVTVVEARDGLDDAAMKRALLEEVERQGVPYGIRILEAHGGETATGAYNFQAFLGETSLATRVFPDGTEEIIRGIDFVGTPLNAVRSILAAGARREVDNSYCGAESGFVPVSTISPALLVGHLELQSKTDTPFTQYVYPIPWHVEERGGGKAKKKKRRRKKAGRGPGKTK